MASLFRRFPVTAGLVLMFALTWPVDLWAAADSHGWTWWRLPPVVPVLVGYGFVVASLVATGVVEGRSGIRALLRRFLVWRVGVVWYAVVLLGPAATDLAAIAVHVALGGPAPNFDRVFARQLFPPELALWAAVLLFLLIGVLTNGEEIGWRGYLLPRLQARHGALAASVVIGVVSAFWHVPKFLTAGSAQDYSLWLFLVDSVAKAVLLTWVFNSTRGSLLMVTLLHASMNTADVFLPILPAATGDVRPFVISVGLRCLAAAVVVLVAGPARLTRSREAVPGFPGGRATQPQGSVKKVPPAPRS
jgi:membrane protease YdiL (CAAX protease family)